MTPEEYVATLGDGELINEIKKLKGQIANLDVQILAADAQANAIRQVQRDKIQVLTAIRHRIEQL